MNDQTRPTGPDLNPLEKVLALDDTHFNRTWRNSCILRFAGLFCFLTSWIPLAVSLFYYIYLFIPEHPFLGVALFLLLSGGLNTLFVLNLGMALWRLRSSAGCTVMKVIAILLLIVGGISTLLSLWYSVLQPSRLLILLLILAFLLFVFRIRHTLSDPYLFGPDAVTHRQLAAIRQKRLNAETISPAELPESYRPTAMDTVSLVILWIMIINLFLGNIMPQFRVYSAQEQETSPDSNSIILMRRP